MRAITNGPVSLVAAALISAATPLLGCCGEALVEQDDPGSGGQGGGGAGGDAVTTSSHGAGGTGGHAGGCAPTWGHVLGGPSSQYARSIAVDGEGDVLASVQFLSGLALDGAPPPGPEGDGFAIVKVDASGAHLWTRTFGEGSTQSEYLPIAVDGSNGVVLGGSFHGTIDIGEGVQATAPGPAALVVKLDADGHPLWARGFPDEFSGARVTNLAVDGEDNIFLVGVLGLGGVDFGWGPLHGDFFLAKLDSTGNPLWAKAFTGALLETRTLAVKSSGAVVLGGSIHDEGVIDLGGGPLASAGGFDVFVAELDGAGNHVHSERFGGEDLQRVYGLAVDPSGDILLAGTFWGAMDFGGATLDSPGEYSSFVARLDPSGKHLWSKRLPGDTTVTTLAVLPSGGLIAGGIFHGDPGTPCGPGTGGPPEISAHLARLNGDGSCLSYEALGFGGEDYVAGLAVHASGRVSVVGPFAGAIDFGGGVFTNDGNDGFVASLAECGP